MLRVHSWETTGVSTKKNARTPLALNTAQIVCLSTQKSYGGFELGSPNLS